MHFTIERKRLVKMIESVRPKLRGKKKKEQTLRIYACAARVFVEANNMTAGEEALVLRDGGCTQPLEKFLMLLNTYSGKEIVTVEADKRKLKLVNSTMSNSGYKPNVKPPAHFVVGQVTDTWVVGKDN